MNNVLKRLVVTQILVQVKPVLFKSGIKKACKASNNRRIKFNIKKSHQNISGGIFGGEPINFDLFLTFYNN